MRARTLYTSPQIVTNARSNVAFQKYIILKQLLNNLKIKEWVRWKFATLDSPVALFNIQKCSGPAYPGRCCAGKWEHQQPGRVVKVAVCPLRSDGGDRPCPQGNC